MPAEARRRVAEETLEIYAPLAGRMGMQEMREELEDLAFREINPEAYDGDQRAARRAGGEQQGADLGDRAAAHQEARRPRHRGDGAGAAQARLFDLAQDGAQVGRLRAAVRHFRLPRHRQHAGRLLRGARHRAHDLAGGARALQGLHLDAEAERLSLDPHHGDRARQPARRTADPHPGDARDRRIRHRRARALQGRQGHADGNAVARVRAPMPGCGAPSNCWPRAPTRKNSSSTPSSSCSTTRCSASRRRAS